MSNAGEALIVHFGVICCTLNAESYQNNSSCRSDESIQEATLQRQPTAAGEKNTRGGGVK